MNRIDELISDFEQYIDTCKPQAFSNRKISVDKEAINDFLAELRMCMPEVIERSEKIVRNKESILNDAQAQAEKILSDATTQKDDLIDEHEIVQKAIERGKEIITQASEHAQGLVDNAAIEANDLKESAYNYVLSSLSNLRDQYEKSLMSAKDIFEQHLITMNDQYEVIDQNYADFARTAGLQAPAESEGTSTEE